MEREIVEKNILDDLRKRNKPFPTPLTLKRMIDKKIREYEKELSE